MSAPPLADGEVMALARTLEVCPDPVRLYADACDGGRARDTLMLESADLTASSGDKSLIVTAAALRLACHGRDVRIEALTQNGRNLLARLGRKLEKRASSVRTEAALLEATFPPVPKASERERLGAPSVLDAVRATILDLTVRGEPSLPPLVAGSFSYDLLGVYESLPEAASDELGWPDYELWLAEELVWVRHKARQSTVLRYVYGGPGAEAAYHDAARALAERVEAVKRVAQQRPTAPAAAQNPAPSSTDVDMDDDAYAQVVRDLKRHIVAGDVFQIVPSRTFCAPCADPLSAYARLRDLNPSPYMFYLHGRRGILFGASPESALTVRGNPKRAAVNPIAGTRPRARTADGAIDADLDARLEAELRLDHKEVAEHMMLVDLARNDIARVSVAGSRRVERLLEVVRYSHVMHLVSLVSGQLRPPLDALHAYTATMNMGTLVGAPKLKAAELLRRYEPSRRGPYGGAVGYLAADGTLDTCIVIRSALVTGDEAHVRAGAGVVYDSDPAAEADETRRKAEAVLVALSSVGTNAAAAPHEADR